MEKLEVKTTDSEQIIDFPIDQRNKLDLTNNLKINVPTPKADKVLKNANNLKKLSTYQTDYDFNIYKKLEQRFGLNQPRGGIIFGAGNPFKIINTHPGCQQCLYAFEMDTYGRGCTHDCAYCYSKAELTVYGYWNRPFPMPIDITQAWKVFYTVFETDKPHKLRDILEKRTPIRIGSGSDGFIAQDRKYRVTYELLKILKHYNYPYIIVTRSDLVAHDDYIDVMDPDLCSIQMSIPSINDELNKKIEVGAPSSVRRLKAIQKLSNAGFWTTVRINPLFPIYPDGYYTDPNFDRDRNIQKLDLFSYDIVQAVAEHGGQSLLAGFVRLSTFAINNIHKSTGIDLRPFFKDEGRRGKRNHYSPEEITAYYDRIHAKCKQHGVEFTTCYIGNGEEFFWKHRHMWDNKYDCCNAQKRVPAFQTDARQISYKDRLKLSSIKKPANDMDGISQELGDLPHDLITKYMTNLSREHTNV